MGIYILKIKNMSDLSKFFSAKYEPHTRCGGNKDIDYHKITSSRLPFLHQACYENCANSKHCNDIIFSKDDGGECFNYSDDCNLHDPAYFDTNQIVHFDREAYEKS